jgi:hypothetical protein
MVTTMRDIRILAASFVLIGLLTGGAAHAQNASDPAPGCEAFVEGVGCARDWYREMPHLEHMSVEERKRYFAAFGADWLKLKGLTDDKSIEAERKRVIALYKMKDAPKISSPEPEAVEKSPFAGVGAKEAKACPVERAVFLAEVHVPNKKPDELRFVPGDASPYGLAKITSDEKGKEFPFVIYVTNGSGLEGVMLEFEDESSHMDTLDSVIVSVYGDFSIGGIPAGPESPVVVMFPSLFYTSHLDYRRFVSAGISYGIFRFARCEPKPHE